MITATIVLFATALLFYGVFGGADFGAGMVEYLLKKKRASHAQAVVTHALAPVWEANHIWLILALVILFSGFPKAFSLIATAFHIPLLLMLVGIVLRGCAFTFRHYDPFIDESHRLYSRTFIAASFLTPLAQGLIVGGAILGQIPTAPSSFYAFFIAPWCNFFSLSVSIFLCCLNFFLASVFLVGETRDPQLRLDFIRSARRGTIALTVMALVVFIIAGHQNFPLWNLYRSSYSLYAIPLAICALVGVWWTLIQKHMLLARFFAASTVGAIMLGWFGATFPFIVGGHEVALQSLNLYGLAAPAATLKQLCVAVAVGAVLIFPLLGILLRTFKGKTGTGDANPHHP